MGTTSASEAASGPVANAGYLGTTPSRAPVAGSPDSVPLADRETICIEIGEHILRALNGQHRGESGRAKLRLASRLYLVFRDIRGNVYNPCKLLYKWSAVKEVCERQGDFRESFHWAALVV